MAFVVACFVCLAADLCCLKPPQSKKLINLQTVFNKTMKWTWLIIILMLLIPTASAVTYPTLNGFVTDNANMIDPSYKDKITQLAQDIEKNSTVEIAVVTVNSLEGESVDMYAVNLFEKAGIGKKDKDNGLLILVAKDSRDYRFEVGYGLEGTITDSMKVNIGDRIIVPNFKNGDYGKGIYESMLVVKDLVNGNPEVVSQYSMPQGNIPQGGGGNIDFSSNGTDAFGALFVVLFILVVIFIVFVAIMSASYSTNTSWKRGRVYTPTRIPNMGWGMGGGGWAGGGGFGGGGFGGGGGGGRSGGGGFGGGFGGFGGGRSGGGGFGGKW
ncbi:TPM domain protein [uncultured archaeon]|nr:TPM domain protein [uncultured archaeon]